MIDFVDVTYPDSPMYMRVAQQVATSAPGLEPAIVGLAYTPPTYSKMCYFGIMKPGHSVATKY